MFEALKKGRLEIKLECPRCTNLVDRSDTTEVRYRADPGGNDQHHWLCNSCIRRLEEAGVKVTKTYTMHK